MVTLVNQLSYTVGFQFPSHIIHYTTGVYASQNIIDWRVGRFARM